MSLDYFGPMAHEVEQRALAQYLEAHNLKNTRQREAILGVFLSASGHITSEEIYSSVRSEHANIGYTTVYRTMKLLCDAGLASERHFDDGITRYEIAHEHHDHLVCLRCGKIIEFECQMIENTQQQIADRYEFRVLRHRHELYGHCASCRKEDA
jgi:Fur family ferric uptake transcriptional regulator